MSIRHDTISVKEWLHRLPFDCRQSFSRMEVASLPQECQALCAAVSSYLQEVRNALVSNEFIDDFTGAKREIALLAIAYFISSDDAENDLNSPGI